MKEFFKRNRSFLIALVVVLLLKNFVFSFVRVKGTSMENTLHNGDILFLNKIKKNTKRGSIVVVKQGGEFLIKRIIALPGEEITGYDGFIYVNGKKLEEPYVKDLTASEFSKIRLKDDEFFIMGDNRRNSLDSRVFGPIKYSQIKGSTNLSLLPFSKR